METFDISKEGLYRAIKTKPAGKDLRGNMEGFCRKTDKELIVIKAITIIIINQGKSMSKKYIIYQRANIQEDFQDRF